MRPLDKWNAGNIILPDGTQFTIPASFGDYHEAKPYLCQNFGCVCSYCENAYNEQRDLDVEHIQPKKFKNAAGVLIYAHLENVWSNFLLSCSTCNGQDNKDTQDVVYGHCHLPHLNNTYSSFANRYVPKGQPLLITPYKRSAVRGWETPSPTPQPDGMRTYTP